MLRFMGLKSDFKVYLNYFKQVIDFELINAVLKDQISIHFNHTDDFDYKIYILGTREFIFSNTLNKRVILARKRDRFGCF